MQTHLARTWFMSRGCKQCPLDMTGNKVLWANGEDGYFLSATGTKQKPNHSKSHRTKGMQCHNGKRGQVHPVMRNYGKVIAHRLMAATYADEPCPIYLDSKGKPYKGIVHHVIEKPDDIRVDNLLWWLDYHQHHIADKRRRALEQVLPDMYAVPTHILKRAQDPRVTSDEVFDRYLQRLSKYFSSNSLNSLNLSNSLNSPTL